MYKLLLAILFCLCDAASLISIETFTDIECTVPSTITPNVSVALDTCVTTIGMESFHFASTPCAGGGATSVQQWGYSDAHCINDWSLDYASYGGHCYGADLAGNAFGSIVLTCKSSSTNPGSDGTSTTISVGVVATGGSASTSTGATGTSSTSSASIPSITSNPTNNGSSGWGSLPLGARIGIIVGIAVFLLAVLYRLLYAQRKKRQAQQYELSGTMQHGRPEFASNDASNTTQYGRHELAYNKESGVAQPARPELPHNEIPNTMPYGRPELATQSQRMPRGQSQHPPHPSNAQPFMTWVGQDNSTQSDSVSNHPSSPDHGSHEVGTWNDRRPELGNWQDRRPELGGRNDSPYELGS